MGPLRSASWGLRSSPPYWYSTIASLIATRAKVRLSSSGFALRFSRPCSDFRPRAVHVPGPSDIFVPKINLFSVSVSTRAVHRPTYKFWYNFRFKTILVFIIISF